jgi:hypothetical protein
MKTQIEFFYIYIFGYVLSYYIFIYFIYIILKLLIKLFMTSPVRPVIWESLLFSVLSSVRFLKPCVLRPHHSPMVIHQLLLRIESWRITLGLW